MLRDNLVGLIEPMGNSAGVDPLALVHCPIKSHRTIDPQCLENPRPEGAESTLAENARSPFQAEPRQDEVIYDLSRPRLLKEVAMNLSAEFEPVSRPFTHYVFLEKHGPFAEVAPPLWNDLMPLLGQLDQQQVREFLGLSGIDRTKTGEDTMIYQAGVALAQEPDRLPDGLQHRAIKAGNYARFLLIGPYSHIWMAFNRIFKELSEKRVPLRPEFCIENYLNDPRVTPEDQLQTELLVPIA